MPSHHETRYLPYSQSQLFDLVGDIERYPQFLPWCKAARILERRPDGVTADLIIGYKMFQEKFTSIVSFERPRAITVAYKAGPLSRLTNQWVFMAAPEGCELSFTVDFDFQSPLLKLAMEMFFDKALRKMAEAFETRAHQLYG